MCERQRERGREGGRESDIYACGCHGDAYRLLYYLLLQRGHLSLQTVMSLGLLLALAIFVPY